MHFKSLGTARRLPRSAGMVNVPDTSSLRIECGSRYREASVTKAASHAAVSDSLVCL